MSETFAIVLGGTASGLAVVRALGSKGVAVAAVHDEAEHVARYSKYIKKGLLAPDPRQAPDEYIDLLVKHAPDMSNGVLIPTTDATLALVSRSKHLLERHFIVACPESHIVELILKKEHTHRLADEHNVPAPKTFLVQSLKDVEESVQRIGFPCLLKPTQSFLFEPQFHVKMFRIRDLTQAIASYEIAAAAGLEVMIQEIIPGDDSCGVNYNGYYLDGQPLVEFTAQQIRNAPPEFGSPRVVMSKNVPEVIEPGRTMLRALGYSGFHCTEFKWDVRDGTYKLMEINGRHNLSGMLAVRCGINFPWLQYQHLVHGILPSNSHFQTDEFWIYITRDVGNSIRHFRRERFSLVEYLKPYLRPHVFAILNLRDLAPFLMSVFHLARKYLGLRASHNS